MMGNGGMMKKMEKVNFDIAKIGVYYYANGDKYDGEWSEDKIKGEGKK